MNNTLIQPHGGELQNRYVNEQEKTHLEEKAKTLYKLIISNRYVSDCEMIANGGFSPLKGFMNKGEVESVITNTQLPNNLLWSIPIILPISQEDTKHISTFDEIALYDKNQRLIALMVVEDIFEFNKEEYIKNIYGTQDLNHPGVQVIENDGNMCIGGEIRLINEPTREHIDTNYYLTPQQTRRQFEEKGWSRIVAFQTRNPIHRAHEYLIKCAQEHVDGALIHPLVGETKEGDIPAGVRMQCYENLLENYFNKNTTILSVLPAAMRYAGPKEAIHHMIIRKNYGCSHMIVGRDHAGVSDYYATYEAQELVDQYREELGIEALTFEHAFYCSVCENVATPKTCPHSIEHHVHLSGTKVREMLKAGKTPPKEFSRREVAQLLVKWGREK